MPSPNLERKDLIPLKSENRVANLGSAKEADLALIESIFGLFLRMYLIG
jgi:hypothetical protein